MDNKLEAGGMKEQVAESQERELGSLLTGEETEEFQDQNDFLMDLEVGDLGNEEKYYQQHFETLRKYFDTICVTTPWFIHILYNSLTNMVFPENGQMYGHNGQYLESMALDLVTQNRCLPHKSHMPREHYF